MSTLVFRRFILAAAITSWQITRNPRGTGEQKSSGRGENSGGKSNHISFLRFLLLDSISDKLE